MNSPRRSATCTCSALTEIGLALFIVTIIVNAIAQLLVWAVTRGTPRAGALEMRQRSAEILVSSDTFKFRSQDANASPTASVTGLAILATVIVVAPLVAIFVYLIYKGASSLNLDFLHQDSQAGG